MRKPPVLTVTEVAGLLRVTRQKVYALIESGQIQGVKIGSAWRVSTESVEQLIGEIPLEHFSRRRNPDSTP